MSRPETNPYSKHLGCIENHAAFDRLFQPGRLTFGFMAAQRLSVLAGAAAAGSYSYGAEGRRSRLLRHLIA